MDAEGSAAWQEPAGPLEKGSSRERSHGSVPGAAFCEPVREIGSLGAGVTGEDTQLLAEAQPSSAPAAVPKAYPGGARGLASQPLHLLLQLMLCIVGPHSAAKEDLAQAAWQGTQRVHGCKHHSIMVLFMLRKPSIIIVSFPAG